MSGTQIVHSKSSRWFYVQLRLKTTDLSQPPPPTPGPPHPSPFIHMSGWGSVGNQLDQSLIIIYKLRSVMPVVFAPYHLRATSHPGNSGLRQSQPHRQFQSPCRTVIAKAWKRTLTQTFWESTWNFSCLQKSIMKGDRLGSSGSAEWSRCVAEGSHGGWERDS